MIHRENPAERELTPAQIMCLDIIDWVEEAHEEFLRAEADLDGTVDAVERYRKACAAHRLAQVAALHWDAIDERALAG